jgi:hypothetical protein
VPDSDQDASGGGNGTVVAQFRRRMSRPPMRRPMGYPPPYPRPWLGEGNPGHAALGALILGGLGATLAANAHSNGQSGPNVVAALFCGGLGAFVGAVIGNNIGWSHSQRYHRNSWPDDDEDASNSRPPAPSAARQAASLEPASAKPSSGKPAFQQLDTPASSGVADEAVPAGAGR